MTIRYRLKKDWVHPNGWSINKGACWWNYGDKPDIFSISRTTPRLKITTRFIKANPDLFEPVSEKPEAPKLWRAGSWGGYFFIDSDGRIEEDLHNGFGIHDDRFETGNYFKTREQAERYAKKEKARRLLQQYADQVNGDWEPDWRSSTQGKYYIFYNYKNKQHYVCCEHVYNSGLSYFKTEELALQAIEDMREQLDILFDLD